MIPLEMPPGALVNSGIEKQVLRIVASNSIQHGRVKGIQPKDPVELLAGKALE